MLFRIVAPHFVAGIDYGIRYAPIVKYMTNWSIKQIITYCATKRWEIKIYES